MIKYDDTVSSQTTGQPIYGAQVTVLNAQGLQATIYSDEAGTIPLSQPILTDQSGYFSFYIDDGRYNVVVMAGQAEIARTNITMVDTLGIKQRALLVPVNEDGGTIAPADARKGMVLAFDAATGAPNAVLPNEFAGPTGPANSTYTSLAALKAAPQSNRSYILADGTNSPVTYAYVAGDFTGRADDVNVVKLDALPLTTGALVRQTGASVDFDGRSVNAKLLENASVTDARFAGGAKGDARFSNSFSTTAGSNILTSSNPLFSAADVGKVVYLTNGVPNGVWFASEITSVLDNQRALLAAASNITQANRRGCWGTDNSAAFEAARDAARFIQIPDGSYIVDNPVDLDDSTTFYGAGISSWEPYTGVDFPGISLTEILVNGQLAFNARGTNNATVRDLSIKAVGGKQSVYRQPPGYQSGAVGIAITGSLNFTCDNVSLFGLEAGISSHTTSSVLAGPPAISEAGVETNEDDESGNVTQMPRLTRMLASDCRRVFRFGTPESTAYTIRDVQISGIVIMLHCGAILEIHWPDGWRMENARLYQCTEYSIYQRKSNFAQIVATVLFETGQDAFVSEDCENTTIAGSTIARTGFYANPVGSPALYPQRTALKLTRCLTTTFQGSIEKPTGRAVDALNCTTTHLSGAWDTPFWLTGNASNASGAINLTASASTSLALAIGGENHWISVFADEASARTVSGHVTGARSTGMTRAAHLQQKGGYVFRLSAEMQIGPGGALPFNGLQDVVPAGKRLVTRCVEITSSAAQLRVVDNNDSGNAIIWNMTPQTFGSFSLETRNLYNNTGTTDVLASVELTLRNPTGAVITLPIGTEIRISTAIV